MILVITGFLLQKIHAPRLRICGMNYVQTLRNLLQVSPPLPRKLSPVMMPCCRIGFLGRFIGSRKRGAYQIEDGRAFVWPALCNHTVASDRYLAATAVIGKSIDGEYLNSRHGGLQSGASDE